MMATPESHGHAIRGTCFPIGISRSNADLTAAERVYAIEVIVKNEIIGLPMKI